MCEANLPGAYTGTPVVGTGTAPLPLRAGLGLKSQHIQDVLDTRPDLGFFEVHAENYMVAGGAAPYFLGRVREHYPISLHGVGLSIGGAEPLDAAHLDRLVALIRRIEPAVFSEHLAWSRHNGVYFSDLLPLPWTRATLDRVCAHVDQVQTRLGRTLLLENPATYLEFEASTFSEAQFLSEVLQRTGCRLLLDISNVQVSCVNHGRDPHAYLDQLPADRVAQIHLAGFAVAQDAGDAPLLIDDHGAAVHDSVWRLYAEWIARHGARPTLIERDNAVPALEVLLAEVERAERLMHTATAKRPASARAGP